MLDWSVLLEGLVVIQILFLKFSCNARGIRYALCDRLYTLAALRVVELSAG